MTRPRLLLVFVATLLAVGLWLLLRNDPTAPPLGSPSHRGPVEQPIAEPAAAGERLATSPIERQSPAEPASPGPGPGASAMPGPSGLNGFVKESNGSGLPDILIELVDAHGVTLLATTTDQTGQFAFEQDPPNTKGIITRPAPHGLPRVSHNLPRGWHSGGPAGSGSGSMTLWRPPTSTIAGSVVDDRGAPVANASISTDRPYVPLGMESWTVLDEPKPRVSLETKTDANGRFELPFVLLGRHLLRAEHGGRSGSVKVDAKEAGVVIRLGTHLGGAVVIAGQLTDHFTGTPIAGARVWVQRVRRSDHGSSAIGTTDATTDQQGHYEVQGLEAGTYLLGSMPDDYAQVQKEHECEAGHYVVDMTLLPARAVRVRVLSIDGQPVKGVQVRVRDADGQTVQVPGEMSMLGDGVRTDANGIAKMRRLPAAQLTLLTVRDDLVAAGRVELDLRGEAPAEVTIELPTSVTRFARKHYFLLLGPDGKPAEIEGVVVASSFDGDALLSRVEGQWRDGKFYFGNEQRNGFAEPKIGVGAIAAECRVVITVPGYQTETLTLAAGAKSPTTLQLRR